MTTYTPGMGTASAQEIHVTGRRVLATVIDVLVLGAINLVFAIPAALIGGASGSEGLASGLSTLASLVALVVWALYYIFMEGYLGQTLGKMACSIKVVREDDGGVPGLGKAALRTVLRIVDGFLAYLVAFIVVLISGKRQRLGDMAAGTLVVRK